MELFLDLVIGGIVFLVIFFIIISPKRKNYDTPTYYYEDNSTSSSPKLSATVSKDFHAEVQRYCRTHNMTISDLVRKSVNQYMSQNN